jgi:lipoprotein-releasing system permease protein
MAAKLSFEAGSFDLSDASSILLGAEAAARLGARMGDTINVLSLSGILPESDAALDTSFTVRGIFRSGFYEYDLGWAFINLDRAAEMENSLKVMLGIKIDERFADARITAQLRQMLDEQMPEESAGIAFSSWRDYNKAFFGALRTEKLFMFLLVGLIFIVVGIQIFQSQRRLVLERSDEIGLLRAVGADAFDVRLVFALNGIIIGGIGAGLGLVLAVLIANNISPIFRTLENMVNVVLRLIHGNGAFAVFSPAVFYIKDVPSRLIPYEVAFIFLFGFISAVAAGWFASKRVTGIHPAEVLRYE